MTNKKSQKQKQKQQQQKQKRIILVGPDKETLELLQSILPEYGFSVSIESHINAVGDRGHFDLVVFDEVEGKNDGLDVFLMLPLGRIKDRFVLLADAEDGERVGVSLNSGMIEYIAKPFDVEELAARLTRALWVAELQEKQVKGDDKIGFLGDLDYLNLSDILMNLHQNTRTGKLYVCVSEGEYVYSFHRGHLVKTTGPNGLTGRKAFYRAMRESGGQFRFIALEKVRGSKNPTFESLGNVILQAVQEADEFPLTRKNLPKEPTLVMLSPQIEDEVLSESTAVQPLLDGLITSTTINILIHACPKTDLQSALELETLMLKGLLVEATSLSESA